MSPHHAKSLNGDRLTNLGTARMRSTPLMPQCNNHPFSPAIAGIFRAASGCARGQISAPASDRAPVSNRAPAFNSAPASSPAADSAADPAAALAEALSAACRQDADAFAPYLTALSAAAFRALPDVQRSALLKRFVGSALPIPVVDRVKCLPKQLARSVR